MTGPAKPERSTRSALPGTGKPHECAICGRRVADARSLKQHVLAAHPAAEGAEALYDYQQRSGREVNR